MRFYGAKYNNIELGIRLVQYCCTLLHKTSYWSRSSAVIVYYRSVHDIINQYMILSISTWYYRSVHDIIDQYIILSISARHYRSVHDIIDQYMILSISTRYYRSVHDIINLLLRTNISSYVTILIIVILLASTINYEQFKQWRSTIPSILTKRTIISHFK